METLQLIRVGMITFSAAVLAYGLVWRVATRHERRADAMMRRVMGK